MGDYDVVIGILAFLILSHLVLVEFQGAEYFFSGVNITEEDLTFAPEAPAPAFQSIDLDSPYQAENVSFVDTDTLNNTDFDTPQTAVLDSGSSSGFVVYNLPEAEAVRTKAPEESSLVRPRTRFTTLNDTREAAMRGENTWILEQDEDFVKIIFESPTGILPQLEPRLYEVSGSRVAPDGGVFGGYFSTLLDFTSVPLRFWDVFSTFPFYVQVFYGGLFLWMIADLLQIG